MSNSRITFVGLTCLDIVSVVPEYPKEDSDQRCEMSWRLGGNAANNAKIVNQLSRLSPACHLISALARDDATLPAIKKEMVKFKISSSHCVERSNSAVPVSSCVISKATGSRTIVHDPGRLLEITSGEFEPFYAIIRENVSWVHFEGRNVREVPSMIHYVHSFRALSPHRVTISVELEKTRIELDQLLEPEGIDVIFVGKSYARSRGFADMKSAVTGVKSLYESRHPGAKCAVVCAWDTLGAAGIDRESNRIEHSPAFTFGTVLDTLGAGDTFIASCIFALNSGAALCAALEFGCKIAGRKCCLNGMELPQDFVKKCLDALPSLDDLCDVSDSVR